MARLFTGSFFPHLESRLSAEIAAAQREDPFRPVAVIVPTRAVRRRLQSALAAAGPRVNVHFFTFYTLSHRLFEADGQKAEPPAPGAVLSLLLRQVIETDLPQDEHTAYFLSYTSSLKRLLALFSRFTSYRIVPPKQARGIERTVFSIYQSFTDRKRKQGIRDADDLIEEAARLLSVRVPAEMPTAVFLYGFYDLNPVQADIVRLLDARGNLTIFSPGGFSAGTEEFFRGTAEFYRNLSGNMSNPAGGPGDGPEPVITTVARELFSPPGAERREAGGAVELITASGTRGEARAVALSILDRMEQDPSLAWHDILVTMRGRAEVFPALSEAFCEYSIPAVFDGGLPPVSAPEVAYFLIMLSALKRGLGRDDVVSLVSSGLFTWPGLPEKDEYWVRDNAWLLREFAVDNRVISGTREWENAFSRHRDRGAVEDSYDDETDASESRERALLTDRYVRAVDPVVTGFLSALTDIPAEAPPADYRDRFVSLVDTYMRPSDNNPAGVGYLKEIMETLTAVSSVRNTITLDECLAVLTDAVSQSSVPSADDIDGVFVSDVMGARLLPRRVVFLMGMNEKVFPHAAGRDAFLTDETAADLGLSTGYERLTEDRSLFALTVACARDVVVISRQRSDEAGKVAGPSPFLDELLSRITIGGAVVRPASDLSHPAGRDYPRITATDRELSRRSGRDIRTALCLGWPADDHPGAVRAVVSESAFLALGLSALFERASDRPFSKYDGLIGPADGLVDIIAPLSAQKLETYAACPFDFFMRYVLSVREEEAVEEELDVEPREMGLIYHRILSRLVPLLVQKGLWTSADNPGVVEGLVDAHTAKEVSGRLSGRIPALIIRARRRRIAGIIGRFLGRERDGGAPGFIPSYYEEVFGPRRDAGTEHPPLGLVLGPREIGCVGRIDRIDINEPESAFMVIDYKRKKGSGTRKLATEIADGRHFQLPIYLMAAESLTAGGRYRPAGGALVYLEADDTAPDREIVGGGEFEEIRDAVMEQIGEVVDRVAKGLFTPAKGDSCRFCAHRDLCRGDAKAVGAMRKKRTTDQENDRGEGEADDDR